MLAGTLRGSKIKVPIHARADRHPGFRREKGRRARTSPPVRRPVPVLRPVPVRRPLPRARARALSERTSIHARNADRRTPGPRH